MPLFAPNARRVELSTDPAVNHRIRRHIEQNAHYYAVHPELIGHRLAELDREWDIERVLEANAATLALGGTVLGLLRHRGFFAVPLLVTAFLLQRALQGWCLPVPFLAPPGCTHGRRNRERARRAEIDPRRWSGCRTRLSAPMRRFTGRSSDRNGTRKPK